MLQSKSSCRIKVQIWSDANFDPLIGVMKISLSTISMIQCSLAIPSPRNWMSCEGCTSARPTRVSSYQKSPESISSQAKEAVGSCILDVTLR